MTEQQLYEISIPAFMKAVASLNTNTHSQFTAALAALDQVADVGFGIDKGDFRDELKAQAIDRIETYPDRHIFKQITAIKK